MPSLREYKEEYALPVNACLNVTNACPLACKYCFVNQNPECMSLEIAQDSVKYLYNNLKRKRELLGNENFKGTINFFGGEPMLMYDEIIVPLVEWTEKTYPNCFSFGITTNGVLLNKKSIQFFYQHNITPLLSMDGDRETQDYNRPYHDGTSSFDKIVAQIPYLLEKFPNTVFRMTIYEDTCDKFFDNVLFAEKMGFKYFYAAMDNRNNFSEKGLKILGEELEKLYLYFVGNIIQKNNFIQCNFFKDSLIRNLQSSNPHKNAVDLFPAREIFRCGLGTTSIAVSPKGKLFGCQEQVTNSNDNIFYLGDIYSGINKDKHFKLLKNFHQSQILYSENKKLCDSCIIRDICEDIKCPSAAYTKFQNFFIQSINDCFWETKTFVLAKEILKYSNPEIDSFLIKIIDEWK